MLRLIGGLGKQFTLLIQHGNHVCVIRGALPQSHGDKG